MKLIKYDLFDFGFENKMFFDASDLFFTDYKWIPEKL